ncbi:hypothetical protein CPB97_002548 [Podila verticillata]|nr:hypothetical protein CPB97_002548 [Podila verticillata]
MTEFINSRKLYLSGNPIHALGFDIGFYRLEYLEICAGCLSELPPIFASLMPNLRGLNLSYNGLNSISALDGLHPLRRLIFVGNNLRHLGSDSQNALFDDLGSPDWLRRDIGFRRSLPDTTYVKRSVYRSAITRACSRLTWFDGGEIQTKERERIPIVLGDLLDTYGRDYLDQRHPEDENIDFDDTVEQELQADGHDLGVRDRKEADYVERQGSLNQNLMNESQGPHTSSSSNGSERRAAYVDINGNPFLKLQRSGRPQQSQVRPCARASPSPRTELPHLMILTNPATTKHRTVKRAEKCHRNGMFSRSRQQMQLLQSAPLTPVGTNIQSTRPAQESDDTVVHGEKSSGAMEGAALVGFEGQELDDDFASVGAGQRTAVQNWKDEVNEDKRTRRSVQGNVQSPEDCQPSESSIWRSVKPLWTRIAVPDSGS